VSVCVVVGDDPRIGQFKVTFSKLGRPQQSGKTRNKNKGLLGECLTGGQ
jgi:hypothetical protein